MPGTNHHQRASDHPHLQARQAASAVAIGLGRSPFERGNRRLTADLLGAVATDIPASSADLVKEANDACAVADCTESSRGVVDTDTVSLAADGVRAEVVVVTRSARKLVPR